MLLGQRSSITRPNVTGSIAPSRGQGKCGSVSLPQSAISGMKGRHALLSLNEWSPRSGRRQEPTRNVRVPRRNIPVRLVTFISPKGAPGPYAGVMKTLVWKYALNRMALCVCFLSALPMAKGAEPITISMTADHWQTKENAEFLRQLGFFHGLMRLSSGNAELKGITFSDGTIEFDVNTIGRGAPGIAFRQQDEGNFELLYLRPDPSCPAFRACIQYAPQTHGVLLWDLFPQYQTRAPLRESGDKNT